MTVRTAAITGAHDRWRMIVEARALLMLTATLLAFGLVAKGPQECVDGAGGGYSVGGRRTLAFHE